MKSEKTQSVSKAAPAVLQQPVVNSCALRHGQRRSRRNSGFTLIEAALATIIISTGVLSILAAQQAYHRKNQWANKSGTAMLLANEIRELTYAMPLHDPVTGKGTLGPETGESTVAAYDDVDDFAGSIDVNKKGKGTVFIEADATWIPTGAKRLVGPINALGNTIPDMPGWSQHVKVENLDPLDISSTFTRALDDSPGVMRVTVDVLYQGPYDTSAKVFGSLSWIATPRN